MEEVHIDFILTVSPAYIFCLISFLSVFSVLFFTTL